MWELRRSWPRATESAICELTLRRSTGGFRGSRDPRSRWAAPRDWRRSFPRSSRIEPFAPAFEIPIVFINYPRPASIRPEPNCVAISETAPLVPIRTPSPLLQRDAEWGRPVGCVTREHIGSIADDLATSRRQDAGAVAGDHRIGQSQDGRISNDQTKR